MLVTKQVYMQYLWNDRMTKFQFQKEKYSLFALFLAMDSAVTISKESTKNVGLLLGTQREHENLL